MIDERPLDALEVENHPEIERRNVEDGRAAADPIVRRVGIATHVVRKEVHHGSSLHNKPIAFPLIPASHGKQLCRVVVESVSLIVRQLRMTFQIRLDQFSRLREMPRLVAKPSVTRAGRRVELLVRER